PTHATGFCGYVKIVRHRYGLDAIVRGDAGWPAAVADRDLLYFLAEAFRARLVKELPISKEHATPALRQFAHRAKGLLVALAEISLECAQLVIAAGAAAAPVLPAWYVAEVRAALPRRAAARAGAGSSGGTEAGGPCRPEPGRVRRGVAGGGHPPDVLSAAGCPGRPVAACRCPGGAGGRRATGGGQGDRRCRRARAHPGQQGPPA